MGAVPLLGGSAVVGSVAGSMNATIGGQALLPNTTIFSGDSLQVNDGVAEVNLRHARGLVFWRGKTGALLQSFFGVKESFWGRNNFLYHKHRGGGPPPE